MLDPQLPFPDPPVSLQCVPNRRGQTCDQVKDGERLDRLLDRVRNVLSDGKRHRLAELARATRGSEAGVSARIRELRLPEHGGHTINKRLVEGESGLWEYRMEVNDV